MFAAIERCRRVLPLLGLALCLPAAADVPAPREADFILHNFQFASGEKLPELRIHYATLGTPARDANGHITNAALILHSTASSLKQFFVPHFAGELFGPGQTLDVRRYFLIFPDSIGHGSSSKPSDGLHARFPQYDYDDMVEAQYRLLREGLGVGHVRLIAGTSMGCMHTWVWTERHPDFMDAAMPLACLPAPLSGRNRMWRTMLMDAIRADPQWHNGEYQQEPTRILRIAAGTLFIAGNGALEFQRAAPTTAATDRYFQEHVEAMAASLDANDLLYALNASRNYDPSSRLESITAPVTLVNFADDFINPPELGIAEDAVKRVKRGRFVLVPVSAETHGHHTHTWARFFDEYLRELLAEAEPRSSGFYTQEQAVRGAKVFNGICSGCHILGGSGAPPRNLEGKDFLAQWNTVNDLFGKVSLTMPASHVLGLRKEEYAAVVAYLLQVNGLPAGAVPLADDREVLRRQFLAADASPTRANTDSDDATGKEGYYSSSQAQRGRAFFQGSCSLCHTVDAAARTGESFDMPLASQVSVTKAPDGLQAGTLRLKFNLAGPQFQDRWRTVGDLYSKVSTAMPAYDADGLNPETYAAIVAYLLQANGLPAGSADLGTNVEALNDMPLLEAGFTKLFNGRDLSGFQLVLGHNCAVGPGGCAATEPGTTFEVRSGAIYCSGKPLGYLYTTKKYLNFTLRLDYRFVPSRSFTPGAEFYGNSGWLLFIDENKVWPRMLEIQGAERTLLEPIAVDGHARFTVDAEARRRVLKPLQWNSVEIVSKGGQVRSYLNGTLISEVTQHDFIRAGHIGFQSEGAEIYFRNIRIREE